MATTAPATQARANGLATYFNVLFAPSAAFEQIARTPMWGWAAIAGVVIAIVATTLSLPETVAATHAFQQQMLAHAAADNRALLQQQFDSQNAKPAWIQVINPIIGLFVSWLITAVVFLVATALSGGSASFSKIWSTTVNAALPSYLGLLVNSVILMLRGPASIGGFSDLFAIPSLAMVVPNNPLLAAFLTQFNPFQLWWAWAAVIGFGIVAGTKRGAAIASAVILVCLAGSIYVWLATFTANALK